MVLGHASAGCRSCASKEIHKQRVVGEGVFEEGGDTRYGVTSILATSRAFDALTTKQDLSPYNFGSWVSGLDRVWAAPTQT